MSEETTGIGDEALTEGLEKKKVNGKVIVLGVVGLVFLVFAVLGIMSLFGGGEDHPEPTDAEKAQAELDQMGADHVAGRDAASAASEAAENEPTKILFRDLDRRTYNLKTDGSGSSFLTVTISLEVDRESFLADLDAKMPRILDELNIYMRELRPEDLDGAAGLFRLKEELLMRINQAVAPTRVKDVLFREFLIQG
ncbi:flagellar basal body-associated FliL family protein [Pseudokordiimonas caeni]|uniref:flagellar basal body-associated FliL family protein n=1 Tax=Pseudokordiimonas caeni TaxID=2997908 RepID=UPI002810B36C|nr:flagellar basal body-associated FliL family protein [Pseudokordiimonas caeni]